MKRRSSPKRKKREGEKKVPESEVAWAFGDKDGRMGMYGGFDIDKDNDKNKDMDKDMGGFEYGRGCGYECGCVGMGTWIEYG